MRNIVSKKTKWFAVLVASNARKCGKSGAGEEAIAFSAGETLVDAVAGATPALLWITDSDRDKVVDILR